MSQVPTPNPWLEHCVWHDGLHPSPLRGSTTTFIKCPFTTLHKRHQYFTSQDIINKQWVLLVITPDGCLGRTRWSSSIKLHPYLYYYYSGCTLESHGHMSFSRMFCDHLTLSCDLAYWVLLYLYSYSIVCLKVLHQVFECMGDFFLLGVLITQEPLEKGIEGIQEGTLTEILEPLTGPSKYLATLVQSPYAKITNLELQIVLLMIVQQFSSHL